MAVARFKMIGSSYLLLIREGKILMLRRFQTGYMDGKYSLPAGHVEDEETLTQSLARESKEEIGITINPKDANLKLTMHRKESDIRMDFFFTVSRYKGEPRNCEPEKCDDMDWFALTKLPKNTVPYIRTAIETFQKGQNYSERWG